MQLQQLTALSLKLDFYGWREYDLLKSSGFNMRKPLRRLRRLPALQELRLAMEWTSAVETASAWAQLPQLCDLEVRDSGSQGFAGRAPRQRLAAVVAQIGATTALTKLVLDVPGQGSFGLDEQQAAADVCAGIIGLTRLKHLELGLHPSARHDGRAPAVVAGDVCMLTALTGLTHLALPHGHGSVGDDRAAKLACCLKQLCHLNLDACCIGSMVCLGPIADLQQLTALHLDSNPGVTQQGLMLLTRLSRLQRLDVCRNAEVTDAAVKHFWSALHGGGGV
uniref:Uncharacterized protein n=1 Tax=Tetradesmus obliquus TaxID=3088 RepID=A0A383WAD4_TETOB|eukprot:jgi/Sobl393_1/11080/SZX74587.1